MGSYSWMIWVSPKCDHMYPCKREAERLDAHMRRGRSRDHRGRDQNNVITSQGMLAMLEEARG